MATPGRKAKGIKWTILYIICGIADATQFIIGLTGVGVLISEAIEVAMPFIIIPILQFTGVSLISRPMRIASLFALGALDALGGGFPPLWVADILVIQKDVRQEDDEYNQAQEQEMALSNQTIQPYYANEEGRVRGNEIAEEGPLNKGEIRPVRRSSRENSRPTNVIQVDFARNQNQSS